MVQQASAKKKEKEVTPPVFASITAADIIRAPVVERSVSLDLAPLLKPFKRAGRLFLRVERLPQRAKLSAGRRNNDGSWSLASDELADLEYLVPSNAPVEHELTIRVMTFEDDAPSTLKVLQYPIRLEQTQDRAGNDDAVCRSNEAHDPVLRSQLGEMQSLFAVRESELVELRLAVQQAKSESAAELQKARAAWEQDLNQRLAELLARAGQERTKETSAQQAEQHSQQLAKAEARAEQKLAAEHKRWQAETEQHIAAERQKWQTQAEQRAHAERERWTLQAGQQIENERRRWQAEAEQRVEAERQKWQAKTVQHVAGERDRLSSQTGQQLEAERRRWQAETEQRGEAERQRWQAQTAQCIEAERQKWQSEADQRDAAERERLRAEAAQQLEAERQRWQAEMAQRIESERQALGPLADRRVAEERERLRAETVQQLEAERQRWQAETAQRIESERQALGPHADRRVAEERERLRAETAQQLEAERQRWQAEMAQRIESERQALGPLADQRVAVERERWLAEAKQQLESERRRWQAEADHLAAKERQAWQVQADQRLEQDRKRHEADSLAALKRAEESWKAQEAARAAAASAEWQLLSARILLDEKDKSSKLEVSLAVEADKRSKLEAALANALAQAKPEPASDGYAAALEQMRDELAGAKAALAARETDLVRSQAEREQEYKHWQQEAQAALEAKAAAWKTEEATRLKVMAEARAQSDEALAQITARCESAEQALTEIRSRAVPSHDDGYIESLQSEVLELRNALVKSETELGWARSALDQAQPLHIRRAVENLPIGMPISRERPEEAETAVDSKRALVRDFLIVVAVAVPMILFYPWFAGYLPEGVRSSLATVTGGLLSAGEERPSTVPTVTPAPAPLVQRPTIATGRSLNVRATPSVKAAVVVSLEKGASLILLEQSGNWTHVEVPATNQQGWVFSANLATKKEGIKQDIKSGADSGVNADAASALPEAVKSPAPPAVEPAATERNPPANTVPPASSQAETAPAAPSQ